MNDQSWLGDNAQQHGVEVEAGTAAGVFATQAAVVLADASAYEEARRLSEDLTAAKRSRVVVEQAKRMLMARSAHLSADDAFGMLVRASQRENVKVADIARRLVERRRPDQQP